MTKLEKQYKVINSMLTFNCRKLTDKQAKENLLDAEKAFKTTENFCNTAKLKGIAIDKQIGLGRMCLNNLRIDYYNSITDFGGQRGFKNGLEANPAYVDKCIDIAMGFDMGRFLSHPIMVNLNSLTGEATIFDGGHRAIAAAFLDLKYAFCAVFKDLTEEEMWAYYATQYENTTRLSPYETYVAGYRAKFFWALCIHKSLKANSFITQGNDKTDQFGVNITAFSTLKDIAIKYGDKGYEALMFTFDVLHKVYVNNEKAYIQKFLMCVGLIAYGQCGNNVKKKSEFIEFLEGFGDNPEDFDNYSKETYAKLTKGGKNDNGYVCYAVKKFYDLV